MDNNVFPLSNVLIIRTNDFCYAIINPQEVTTGYMDLVEYFSQRSSRGNEYILVSYHFNTNHIRGIPIKNRKGFTILEA